jgi:hypothetical protein
MKKVILFGAFALLTLAFCKKDWVCTCTVGNESYSDIIQDKSKSDAKAECDSGDGFLLEVPVECGLQ